MIGRARAVAQFGSSLRFSGIVAWLLWLFVHLMYLVTFQNRVIVFIRWGFNYIDVQSRRAVDHGGTGGSRPARGSQQTGHMPKFVVHNFGCRASQADGAAIESMLARNGSRGSRMIRRMRNSWC